MLRLAAREGRILVSHDESTLPVHFARFLAEHQQSPGVFLAPQDAPIRDVIDALVSIWPALEPSEWMNQIFHLPSIERHSFW